MLQPRSAPLRGRIRKLQANGSGACNLMPSVGFNKLGGPMSVTGIVGAWLVLNMLVCAVLLLRRRPADDDYLAAKN